LNSPGSGASLGSPPSTTVTIVDNDSGKRGTLQFSAPSYSVAEGGTLTVTITRTDGADGAVGVYYAAANGTALAASDYALSRGWIWFADGVTSRTITLAAHVDSVAEAFEYFGVALSNPVGGAVLGTRRNARVWIANR